MKFRYYPNDAMDTVPAPPGKMILSLLAMVLLFLALLYGMSFILGFSF